MKKEFLYLLGFILVMTLAVGVSMIGKFYDVASGDGSVDEGPLVIPQLESEGREDASTMVLIGTPPMQPADHIDRWNPEIQYESCMTCHATPDLTGAREIPEDHFYDNNRDNPIFRHNCIQCHGQQNDTKSAFNED